MPLIYIIASVITVSLISLIGLFTIGLNQKLLNKILLYLVSFSAGALFGDVFIHLLPETIEKYGFTTKASLFLLAGIVIFFVIEKIIHWHHCHGYPEGQCPHKSFTYMNLIGDGIHNFIDGIIIAASFIAGTTIGIATTIAVIFHEIPQEIGDYAILIHGGFTRKKALLMNFLSALTALIGAIIVIFLSTITDNTLAFFLPFTAGSFIYIAGSDLIPELHKEYRIKESIRLLIAFILGITVMYSLIFLE